MAAPLPRLRVENHPTVAYAPMLALQAWLHDEVAAGRRDDTLLLLEHRPVVTTGRNGRAEHVLHSAAELRARGIDLVATGRGGDVTYHGPGQLVAYFILRLGPAEQDVRQYVGRLEEVLIRCAAELGVVAGRVEGLRGIWVGSDKLAAVGVRLARWVTSHGVALNVDIAPEDFGCIVPCGLHGRGVTSLRRCGAPCAVDAVRPVLVRHAAAVLGRLPYAAPCSSLPAAPTPLNVARGPAGRGLCAAAGGDRHA